MNKKPSSNKKTPSLNPRRLMFCKEYLVDFNGTQAAIRAGYSENTANEQAAQLLAKLSVRAEVDRLRKEREDRLEASADFVVRELMRLAKVDIRDAFDENGCLKDIHDMPEDLTRCISSIEIKDLYEPREDGPGKEKVGFTKTIRVWDKKGALELLGEHFGIFKRFGSPDAKEDGKKKKADLLQVIKLIAKDGQTTIIKNRLSSSPEESPSVVASRPRGLSVV